MRTIALVARNLSTRKGRSIMNSIGLILAIAVIISTFTISSVMERQIGNEVEKYGPNIVVTPKTQSINLPYGNVVIGSYTIPESYAEKIYTIPNKQNIRVLSPRLYGQVQHGSNEFLLAGINPEQETQLKKWWNVDGALPQNGTNEAVIGSVVRSSLNVEIGSILQIKNTTLTVVGALEETGSDDDYFTFLPLQLAQTLLGLADRVSLIDVGAICNDCPVEEISRQIMSIVPDVRATPIRQAVETKIKAVEQAANFSLILAVVILFVGCASITNTMLASVRERTKEIGILLSLGADNTHLRKLFFTESLILGLAGGLLGILVGLVSSMLFVSISMRITTNLAEIPLFQLPLAIALSISACLAASLYPTWRASKIDPVKALSTV